MDIDFDACHTCGASISSIQSIWSVRRYSESDCEHTDCMYVPVYPCHNSNSNCKQRRVYDRIERGQKNGIANLSPTKSLSGTLLTFCETDSFCSRERAIVILDRQHFHEKPLLLGHKERRQNVTIPKGVRCGFTG